MEPFGLKPAEVAPLLGYRSKTSVYELIWAGLLHPIAGCKAVRVSPAEVERFANATKPRPKDEVAA